MARPLDRRRGEVPQRGRSRPLGPPHDGAVGGGLEAVIGLEIHAQLKTRTKIFCGCLAEFGGPPNTHICPVCLGLPGALPALNERAVTLALRVAAALGCEVAPCSFFARKNYFYPDLPKGYQITQYEQPLATGGAIAFRAGAKQGEQELRIARIHLEEDAGKLIHEPDRTLIDYNRAGVPLLEIVTGPDLRTGEQAHACLRRLRQILIYLDACDGNLEEGSLRCDANVSLRMAGGDLGAKVEIKNLNSFRGVWKALDHEIARQSALLAWGEEVVRETRGWDAATGTTVPQRRKEESDDYRYFPEPDLTPLLIGEAETAAAVASLPELPAAREARLAREHGLPHAVATQLCEEPSLADYFEATARALGDGRAAANWMLTEVLAVLKERSVAIVDLPIVPEALAGLLALMRDGHLSGRAAKRVFAEMSVTGEPAPAVMARLGLEQISDAVTLSAAIKAVMAAHPTEVAAYRRGKTALLGFFVGRVVAATGGRANPNMVSRLLADALES